MQKAVLTGRQRGAAVFAGIFGHLIFAAGWLVLGFVLLGGGIVLLFGGTINGIANAFGGAPNVAEFLTKAGGVILVVGIVFGAVAFILMLVGFLVSGFILRANTVRKPWATTLTSILIVAAIDLPLFFVYIWLASKISETNTSGPVFLGPFVGIIGTIVVGVLVWLWMTWAHRGKVASVPEPVEGPERATQVEGGAPSPELVQGSERATASEPVVVAEPMEATRVVDEK